MMDEETGSVLSVKGLRVLRGAESEHVLAVDGVDLEIRRGETVAIVGESGSGKSSLASAVAGLLPRHSTRIEGRIEFLGQDLLGAGQDVWNRLRGEDLAIVFQDQATALNPVARVGAQVGEAIEVHHPEVPRDEVHRRVVELLGAVGIVDPEYRDRSYPHELSGGMRQRVLIAMAIANSPALLIADEPTTALDVTIQAQVLRVLKKIQLDAKMAMLFITHNLEIVATIADRVVVMRHGQVVETGLVEDVFDRPQHEYTRQLLDAIPKVRDHGTPRNAASEDGPAALEVAGLHKSYGQSGPLFMRTARSRPVVRAVDDVSLRVEPGRTLSIVGESGSGKTTLARCVAGLTGFDAGEVSIAGRTVGRRDSYRRKDAVGSLQFVFQDPFESLDPAWTVRDIVAEPLRRLSLGASERNRIVDEALESVSMSAAIARRKPREFSGGERQRISIARAIVRKPRVLVLDEPTASLDVSIQARVMELLRDIQAGTGVAYLFITHDLALANNISDHIAVMRGGKVVEYGPVDDIFHDPQHEYTRQLLASRHIWKEKESVVAPAPNRA